MKKFEYKTFWLTLPGMSDPTPAEQMIDKLGEKGEEGWEVCATLHQKGLTTILLLKREIN